MGVKRIIRPPATFKSGKLQLTSALNIAFRQAIDLVFPQTCVHCESEGQLLCARCLDAAARIGNEACRTCGLQLEYGSRCGKCAEMSPALARVTAVFQFEGAMRDAVHALKYRDLRAIAPALGAELAADVQARHRKIDVVAPVPLHRRRLRSRGYNQAELLARPVAARLGVPMSTDLLSRVTDNPPQAQARNEAARSAAVRNAFAASSEALGKRVLLIDDVATTCSTLNACGRALRQAGAESVRAAVLAREQ